MAAPHPGSAPQAPPHPLKVAAVVAFIAIAASVDAWAERRVALVVGNSNYKSVPMLPNPRNDAEDVSAALQKLGFDVKTKVDASKHDIDLALWFFGQDSVVKSVTAVGTISRTPGLEESNDVDNGVGIVEFYGGKVAYFYSSRMMMPGQPDMNEIIGTHGKLSVNANPANDLVEMHEPSGIRREIAQTYYDRFEQAFVKESNEFTECVLDDKKLPFKLTGAVQAVVIGCALQESLLSGKKIDFDPMGNRIVEAKAKL